MIHNHIQLYTIMYNYVQLYTIKNNYKNVLISVCVLIFAIIILYNSSVKKKNPSLDNW